MQQRIITGLFLALFAVSTLFLLPVAAFKLIIIVISLIGMYEWLNTHGLHERFHLQGYAGLILLIIFQSYYPILISLCAIIVIGFYTSDFRKILLFEKHRLDIDVRRDNMGALIQGVIILATFVGVLTQWKALPINDDDQTGTSLIVLTALIVVASDVGAYFAGKLLGTHKLCPQTSPKKTWEGFIVGLLCSALIAMIFIQFYEHCCPINTIFPALFIGTASVIGDLKISLSKRIYGIKDTGHILPGHGGVLDRLDGWLIAFPIAYLLF